MKTSKTILHSALFAFSAILVLTNSSLASEAGHHGQDEGIPLGWIARQGINLLVFAIILFIPLRKKIPQMFKERREKFLEQKEITRKTMQEAEDQLLEARQKLEHVEKTTGQSLEKARAEAERQKTEMIQNAQAQAIKIKDDSEKTILQEVALAKKKMTEKVFAKAVEIATNQMQSKSKDSQKVPSINLPGERILEKVSRDIL